MNKVLCFPENRYICLAEESESNQSPLQKALASFESRLGVSYNDLATSKEAQKIAKKNLDRETMRLREKYLKQVYQIEDTI